MLRTTKCIALSQCHSYLQWKYIPKFHIVLLSSKYNHCEFNLHKYQNENLYSDAVISAHLNFYTLYFKMQYLAYKTYDCNL